MLKSVLFLITVLLIPGYSICQTTYPRFLINGKDTTVELTLSQMDSVNRTFSWNAQLRAANDSLLSRIDSVKSAFTLFHHSDSVLRVENGLYQRSITDRDVVITNQTQVIKDQKKDIRRLKVHKGILAALDITLIVAIVYLLIL